MVAGAAVQKYMQKLGEEQEILMNLADMLIEGYVAESTLLRVEKLAQQSGEGAVAIQTDIMRVYLYEAIERQRMQESRRFTHLQKATSSV